MYYKNTKVGAYLKLMFFNARGGTGMAEKKNDVAKVVYLQYMGREISLDEVERLVRENYDSVKKGSDQPEDIKIYLKPEDRKAYYVINCDFAGEVDLLPEEQS